MNADIDIDKLWMEERRGTIALPVSVSGAWKLNLRVWIGTKLIRVAAWILNLDVDVTDATEGA